MIRYLLVLAMLAGTAIYGWTHPPLNLAEGRGVLARVPAALGEWSGAELSFEDAVVEELRADDILIRRYSRGAEPVWLCIVYHQNRRYGSHDPRVCYESQGYLVERERDGRIDDGTTRGVPSRWFTAQRAKSPRLVAYWWSTAGLQTTDAWAFRRQMALRGALDNRSWGAFVRIETPIVEGDEAAAARRLQEFGARVARALPAVFEPEARAGARDSANAGSGRGGDAPASAPASSPAEGAPAAR